MGQVYEEAKKRMPSQQAKVLKALKDAGENGVTNEQLQKIALRFNHSIHALKKEGYEIAIEPIEKGFCKYYLISEPKGATTYQEAIVKMEEFVDIVCDGKVKAEDLESILMANNLLFKKLSRSAV